MLTNSANSGVTVTGGALAAGLSVRLLAEHIFNDLRSQGLKDKDIVKISSELLSQLSKDILMRNKDHKQPS